MNHELPASDMGEWRESIIRRLRAIDQEITKLQYDYEDLLRDLVACGGNTEDI